MQHKSFTLTEIMVVAAILVILTATTLAGLRIQRTNQRLDRDAQRIEALFEKARAYATHPRTQDYRPIYYMVRFDLATSGTQPPNDSPSARVMLNVYSDIDNNGRGDPGSPTNPFTRNIETIIFNDTQVLIPNSSVFKNKRNLDQSGFTDLRSCDINNGGIASGSSIELGFKVGEPERIRARCWQTGAKAIISGSPSIIFQSVDLELQFQDFAYQTDFEKLGKQTYLRISNYGEIIEDFQE